MSEGSCDVANDDGLVTQMRLHQECWELLPWVVNGRLSSADAARVSEHLRECSRCSEELHAQQQLCEAMRWDDPVLLAPQASLKKIWQRFDGVAPAHGEPEREAHGTVAHNKSVAAPASTAESLGLRRIRKAMAAQALLIVGLLGLLGWQTFERWQAPRFATASSPATAGERDGSVRVVFSATASVQDVNALLRSLRAEILAGPSSAGVFTLALPTGVNADSAARQLRADARVQFAEPTPAALVQP
jgi:hypothetical protein